MTRYISSDFKYVGVDEELRSPYNNNAHYVLDNDYVWLRIDDICTCFEPLIMKTIQFWMDDKCTVTIHKNSYEVNGPTRDIVKQLFSIRDIEKSSEEKDKLVAIKTQLRDVAVIMHNKIIELDRKLVEDINNF